MIRHLLSLGTLAVSLAAFGVTLAACMGPGTNADAGAQDGGADGGADGGSSETLRADWLYTEGNRIKLPGGQNFHGRGANIFDTRQCNACAYGPPSVAAVKFRVDELVDKWKANFLRLDLESYSTADGRSHYQGVLQDAAYLADVVEIVRHIGKKPGVYVLLSLWIDPTFTDLGWPTAGTTEVWKKLAETFRNDGHVLFGVANEPEQNGSGAEDLKVWTAMNDVVAGIRTVEDQVSDAKHHIVVVQGTRMWARSLVYYVTKPIAAGGGTNVAYETHVYDPPSQFKSLFEDPAKTIPVIIGEFGAGRMMTLDDCLALMPRAEAAEVPYLGWAMHHKCDPNLVTSAVSSCAASGTLMPTAWGQALKQRLASPW
jgi:endoglucanase